MNEHTADIICIIALFAMGFLVFIGLLNYLEYGNIFGKTSEQTEQDAKTLLLHVQEHTKRHQQLSTSGLLTEVALITESLTNTRHRLTSQMDSHHIQDFKDTKYYRGLKRELLKWQIMLGEEPFK